MAKSLKIFIDLDKTFCSPGTEEDGFEFSEPYPDMVDMANYLVSQGHQISFFTARSEKYREVSERMINNSGVEYQELVMDKPFYHIFIEDRAIDWNEGMTEESLKKLVDRIESEQ